MKSRRKKKKQVMVTIKNETKSVDSLEYEIS